jgi:hypothetical protein
MKGSPKYQLLVSLAACVVTAMAVDYFEKNIP